MPAELSCRLLRLAHTLTIARFTALEAVRTRLPWLWVGVLALIGAASLFVNQIAITESARLQWTFYAAGVRLAAVFTAALYITSSMVRELTEKGHEVALALDMPRAAYVTGKLLAFVLVAAAMALLAAIPLAVGRPLGAVGLWTFSLACELALVAAFTVFCTLSFGQVVPAILAVTAFYLLARSIDALRLLSESAVLGELSGLRWLFEQAFAILALLLPALDRYTLTAWIGAPGVDVTVLAPLCAQTLLYAALLLAASLVDFHRREL
jgi:ABC-type transport system involved in multi-copper enzyme maturation permease subunit